MNNSAIRTNNPVTLRTAESMIHYHGFGTPPGSKELLTRLFRAKHCLVSFPYKANIVIVAATCQSFILDNGAFSAWQSSNKAKPKMIHYHGALADGCGERILKGKHALVPFSTPKLLNYVSRATQSFVLDNGAFAKWKSGKPTKDWHEYYDWVEEWMCHPGFDWAAIPDVIGGTEDENDELLDEWPHGENIGTPVYHMHESLDRLRMLAGRYRTVAIGSSGKFSSPGTRIWWSRMDEVMRVLCPEENDYRPVVRIHGMRMLNKEVFTRLPLASADSVNVARNMHMKLKRKFAYHAPPEYRARLLLEKNIEPYNSCDRYTPVRFTNGHLFK